MTARYLDRGAQRSALEVVQAELAFELLVCPFDSPTLLDDAHDLDVLRCARCGGRVRVRAVVTNHAVAGEILAGIANKRASEPPGGVVA